MIPFLPAPLRGLAGVVRQRVPASLGGSYAVVAALVQHHRATDLTKAHCEPTRKGHTSCVLLLSYTRNLAVVLRCARCRRGALDDDVAQLMLRLLNAR